MEELYRNQWERDIHIWHPVEAGVILAGCIAEESLTYSVLYSWLQAIFLVRLHTFPTGQWEVWYLVPSRPPSRQHPPIVDNLQPIPPTDTHVRKGHYVVKLFIQAYPGATPTFTGDPDVGLVDVRRRTRVPSRASSSNGTPDSPSGPVAHRDSGFRRQVRKRDGWCRLSGTLPGHAVDGLNRIVNVNYTGFQAAHIFPLAFAHRDENGSDAELHFDSFSSCWPPGTIQLQNAQAVADSPANDILLHADLHLFFDAYQFAFLVPLDGTLIPDPPVIRFNRSAAPIFSQQGPNGNAWKLLPSYLLFQTQLEPTLYQRAAHLDPINMNLFRAHLLYCVRLRVRGEGI